MGNHSASVDGSAANLEAGVLVDDRVHVHALLDSLLVQASVHPDGHGAAAGVARRASSAKIPSRLCVLVLVASLRARAEREGSTTPVRAEADFLLSTVRVVGNNCPQLSLWAVHARGRRIWETCILPVQCRRTEDLPLATRLTLSNA